MIEFFAISRNFQENQMLNACPEICSESCEPHSLNPDRRSCWNENTCQRS